MSCFWFGHKLPNRDFIKEELRAEKFICPRCRKKVKWDKMPKAIKAIRDEYLRRVLA